MIHIYTLLGVLALVPIMLGLAGVVGSLIGFKPYIGSMHVGTIIFNIIALYAVVGGIVGVLILIFRRPGTWLWVVANPLLVATGVLTALAIVCFVLGWNTVGWVLLAIALVVFLKHSCRWWNWCRRIRVGWRRGGRAKVVQSAREAFTWCTQVATEFSASVRANVLPWIKNDVAPWVKDHALVIVWAGSALVAWWLHNDDRSFAEQTVWFWAATAVAVVIFLVWCKTCQEGLGAIIRAFASGIATAIGLAWGAFKTHTTFGGKVITFFVAGGVLAWVSNLIHGKLIRGKGWLTRLLDLPKEQWSWEGVLLVFVVLVAALIAVVIMMPHVWNKAPRPAAPAAPAHPRRRGRAHGAGPH